MDSILRTKLLSLHGHRVTTNRLLFTTQQPLSSKFVQKYKNKQHLLSRQANTICHTKINFPNDKATQKLNEKDQEKYFYKHSPVIDQHSSVNMLIKLGAIK